MKQLAAGALAEVPRRHAPDAVLAALTKSLALARAAKVKVAVLDYFSAAATGSLCPDLEEGLELGAGAPLRALVGGMLGMALDKNADIRRAAVRALGVVYAAEQGQVRRAGQGCSMLRRHALPASLPEAPHCFGRCMAG